jgi:hypothetical protein
LSAIVESHWGGGPRAFARHDWRQTAQWAIRQFGVEGGVEGMGRVFTRKLGEGRSKLRRHDGFAKALVLELPLLHQRQHETATRIAAAALNG